MIEGNTEDVERLERYIWLGMPTKQQVYERVQHICDLEKKAIEAMQEKYDRINDETKYKDTEKEKAKEEKKDKENKKTTNEKENSKKDGASVKEEKHFDSKKLAELFKVKLKVVNSSLLNKQDEKNVGYYESKEQKLPGQEELERFDQDKSNM